MTEIGVTAVLGGVQMIAPPGLAVEIEGTSIMGGFDHGERTQHEHEHEHEHEPHGNPERPSLRIRGVAVMGGVHVEMRLPGEGEGEGEAEAEGRRCRARKPLSADGRERRRQLAAPK